MKTKLSRIVFSAVLTISLLAASSMPYSLFASEATKLTGSTVQAEEISTSAENPNNEEALSVDGNQNVEETFTTKKEVADENVAAFFVNGTERAGELNAVYVNSSSGDDTKTGADEADAVKTLSKALEIVAEGGTIHFVGEVLINENMNVDKNVSFSYNAASDRLVIASGVSFSVTNGKTVTFKGEGSSAINPAVIVKAGGVIGDGNYTFDFSKVSESNRMLSGAFKLEGNGTISGSASGAVKITAQDMNILSTGTSASSKIVNADITQSYSLKSGSHNVGNAAPYTLENTVFKLTGTSKRFRFDQPFSMINSELIVDNPNQTSGFAIIFATTPNLKDSTIDIKNYGSILLDLGTGNATNTTIKTDGIHNAKTSKPFATKFFGEVANTAVFTFDEDPQIGRISFKDSNNNSYEYGLPLKHNNEVSKGIPLPKVKLTFKSEDGNFEESVTLIKGTSLEKLSGKAYADGAKIDKSKIDVLKKKIEEKLKDTQDFKLLINGNENALYNISDTVNDDTVVVLKPITAGTRYYVNDGSENTDKYTFVEKNDDKNSPLSIEEVTAKAPMFKVRSKKFVGWTLDKEGNLPATNIDITKLTKLYAKWEDKKAFNVTYHRNSPTASSVSNPETITATLYEGEHISGVLVDFNKNIHLISDDESEGQIFRNDTKEYYQKEFGNKAGAWNYIGEYNWKNILLDDYKNLYRFQAWNTAKDGSGTYYRGGHTLTAEDFEKTGGNLVLYNQWIELEKLKKADAAAIADPDRARPEIKLSGEYAPEPSDYETARSALVIDHSQALNYKAFLDFHKIQNELVTLWGRINEVTQWDGTMNAYFDSRLDFDKDVKILFESTWQVPDMAKLAEYGVLDVKQVEGNANQWIFTISRDFIKKDLVDNRKGTDKNYDSSSYSFYEVKLPVKIIPKYDPNGGKDFQKLSFEEFMKPMVLTVYDNYDRGINGYITKESANKIALSDQPVVIVGGDIQMNINGFERQGLTLLKYQLKSNAFDEHVKIFPTGTVNSRYELVDVNDYSNILKPLQNPKTGNESDSYEGRAKNEKIKTEDPNNYSEKFSVEIPKYTADGNIEKYKLVAIKAQVQKVDSDGNYETDEDGSPKIEEAVYSDKYYTKETGKKGSLEEGKKLLSGEFDHSRIVTYVMQYAVPAIDLDVNKIWLDYFKEPMKEAPKAEVKVELLRDGEPTGDTVTLNRENNFKGQFVNLKEYSDDYSKKYNYSVRESGTSEEGMIVIDKVSYKSEVEGADNQYTITNTSQEKPETPKPHKTETKTPLKDERKTPGTGDESNFAVYGTLLMISLAGLVTLKKRRLLSKRQK